MSNLLLYLDYYKRTILFVGGYVVVLISIPLTFMLVQSSQIFRSRAYEVKTNINTSQKTTSEVPSSSPLEDLKALSESPIYLIFASVKAGWQAIKKAFFIK